MTIDIPHDITLLSTSCGRQMREHMSRGDPHAWVVVTLVWGFLDPWCNEGKWQSATWRKVCYENNIPWSTGKSPWAMTTSNLLIQGKCIALGWRWNVNPATVMFVFFLVLCIEMSGSRDEQHYKKTKQNKTNIQGPHFPFYSILPWKLSTTKCTACTFSSNVGNVLSIKDVTVCAMLVFWSVHDEVTEKDLYRCLYDFQMWLYVKGKCVRSSVLNKSRVSFQK